jgi:hypothetical protein
MEVIPRPSHTPWQVLLYIVAAIGAFTASDTPSDIDLALFEAAKARLSIDFRDWQYYRCPSLDAYLELFTETEQA